MLAASRYGSIIIKRQRANRASRSLVPGWGGGSVAQPRPHQRDHRAGAAAPPPVRPPRVNHHDAVGHEGACRAPLRRKADDPLAAGAGPSRTATTGACHASLPCGGYRCRVSVDVMVSMRRRAANAPPMPSRLKKPRSGSHQARTENNRSRHATCRVPTIGVQCRVPTSKRVSETTTGAMAGALPRPLPVGAHGMRPRFGSHRDRMTSWLGGGAPGRRIERRGCLTARA